MAEKENQQEVTVALQSLNASLQQDKSPEAITAASNKPQVNEEKLRQQEQALKEMFQQASNQQAQTLQPSTPRPTAPVPSSNLTSKNQKQQNKRNQIQARPSISKQERLQNNKTILQETSRLLVNQLQNNAGRVPKWQKNSTALNRRVLDTIMNGTDTNLKNIRSALLRNFGGKGAPVMTRANIESTLKRLMPSVSRAVLLAHKNQLEKMNQNPTAEDAARNKLQSTGATDDPMFRRLVTIEAAANQEANNLMYFLDKDEEIKEEQAKDAYNELEDNTNQANLIEEQEKTEAIEESANNNENSNSNSLIMEPQPQESMQQNQESTNHHRNQPDEKHDSMLREIFGETAKETFAHKALEALESAATSLPSLSR